MRRQTRLRGYGSDAGASDCTSIKRLGRLIIKAFIARDDTVWTNDARVLPKALEERCGIYLSEKEIPGFIDSHREINKTLLLFPRSGRDGNGRTDEGRKIVHDKLGVDFLEDGIVLIAMEIERSHDVLNAPERGFNLPAFPVNLTDHIRREQIAREISDEQLEISSTEINTNETKIDIEIVRFIKEVKGPLDDDLKIRDVGVSIAAMEGELFVEREVELGIGKLIA